MLVYLLALRRKRRKRKKARDRSPTFFAFFASFADAQHVSGAAASGFDARHREIQRDQSGSRSVQTGQPLRDGPAQHAVQPRPGSVAIAAYRVYRVFDTIASGERILSITR
jgi:hypothetical protein